VVALLPIGMGALVTTLGAGMAFADWPSSDGQNMLLYPWFSDFRDHPDKFVEHGHRLAGVLIGLMSLLLAVVCWRQGTRRECVFGSMILLSVIAQGALGGARVLLDRQTLAMTHSLTGAAFFTLCVLFRFSCSPGWRHWLAQREEKITPGGAAIVALSPVAISGQYVLGGMLRHLNTMLNEHLAGAAIVGLLGASSAFVLLRCSHGLLRRTGMLLIGTLLLQVLLGAGSYVTRFGLQSIGYVATVGSPLEAVTCSAHTVAGMFLLASSCVAAGSLLALHRADLLDGFTPTGSLASSQRGAVV
jgi:heme a synthase